MDIFCKNCGHQLIRNGIFCENCGAEISWEETNHLKVFNRLMFIYPFFLFLMSYIIASPGFVEDSANNLGQIIGAALILSIIPVLVVLIRRLLRKKQFSDKSKVQLFYGYSSALFILFWLGQLAKNIRGH